MERARDAKGWDADGRDAEGQGCKGQCQNVLGCKGLGMQRARDAKRSVKVSWDAKGRDAEG